MDRLEAMKIFVRVAELQSFTQAAESLYLPKASVSTSIQKLESLVNVRLLHRTTRRVQLTAEGLLFYERCKELLSDIDETESMFRSDSAQLKGKIRVDMVIGMAQNMIVPRLSAFLNEYPGIELELSSTDRRVDLIRESIDCVIRVGSGVEAGLLCKELGRLKILNCASPAYLAKYGHPKSLEDLRQHKLIHYLQHLGGKPDGFEYFDGEKFRELKMASALTVNNTVVYEAACLAGLGIIQAPLAGMEAFLEQGQLIEILPELQAEPMPLTLIYPQRRLQARRVRVFMDWIESVLKAFTL